MTKISNKEGFSILMKSPCSFTIKILMKNCSTEQLKTIRQEWLKITTDNDFASKLGNLEKVQNKHKNLLSLLEKKCKKKNLPIF